MVVDFQFYRENNCPGLENSIETENFTLQRNDMFDALNRKYFLEGIKRYSNDLEVSYVLHDDLFVCVTNFYVLINLLLLNSICFGF